MSEIYLKRSVGGLVACDDHSVSVLRRIRVGDIVQCEVTQPRNLAFHRKFFALLNVVWETSGDWQSVYALLIELKVNVGHIQKAVIRETGEVVSVPKSISFAQFDETSFAEFYEKCLIKLCEMAGGIEAEALRQEVLNKLGAE